MKRIAITFLCLLAAGILFLWLAIPYLPAVAQQPTVSIPTVTSSPFGPQAAVKAGLDEVPIHSGPGQDYPKIGVLFTSQKVPALAVDTGGDWIEIQYFGVPGSVGWVFKNLVDVPEGLAKATPPPTPTPRVTPTIDATLAAQNLGPVPAAPLPTFTPPPPLLLPTYQPKSVTTLVSERVPMAFLIIGLAVVGLFGTFLSLLRGR